MRHQFSRPVSPVKGFAVRPPHVDPGFIGESPFTPVLLSQMTMSFSPSKSLFLVVFTDEIGLDLSFSLEKTFALQYVL